MMPEYKLWQAVLETAQSDYRLASRGKYPADYLKADVKRFLHSAHFDKICGFFGADPAEIRLGITL